MTDEASKISKEAELIANSPKLVSEYFSNPSRLMAQMIPETGLSRIMLQTEKGTKKKRVELSAELDQVISSRSSLSSMRNAYLEKELFLKEGMQNPQKTFNAVLWLSVATFAVGVAFIVCAFIAGFTIDDTTQKSVLAGISGGGGLIATLGSIFATSRDSIRRINGDNVQIRVILNAFASEIANLRAVEVNSYEVAEKVNKELRQARREAVRDIQEFTEPKD